MGWIFGVFWWVLMGWVLMESFFEGLPTRILKNPQELTKEIKECSEFKEFKERTQIPNFTNLAKFFNGFWWVLMGSDGDFSLRPNRYQLPTRTHKNPQELTPQQPHFQNFS
ncbi:MAG: hypothetical protein UHS52_02925 [Alistipes sp.]|nr:hypothetical protein [Alistipes sp.]